MWVLDHCCSITMGLEITAKIEFFFFKMGYLVHFPQAIVYAPIEVGGLGF